MEVRWDPLGSLDRPLLIPLTHSPSDSLKEIFEKILRNRSDFSTRTLKHHCAIKVERLCRSCLRQEEGDFIHTISINEVNGAGCRIRTDDRLITNQGKLCRKIGFYRVNGGHERTGDGRNTLK